MHLAWRLLYVPARPLNFSGTMMSTYTKQATKPSSRQPRWHHALWLTALLLAFPFAAGAQDETGAADATATIAATATMAEADVDARLILGAPTSALSDEVLVLSHAKGLVWDAPAVQTPAVILWDEAGSGRRTGSGQPNAQASDSIVTVNGRR
jgi:hypothetical protein